VSLIDVADRPLAAALSRAQPQRLLDAWSVLSIRFVGGVQLQAMTATGTGKQITTTSGQQLTVDHFVVAAGVQTPGQLAASAGLTFNNGIAVDADTLGNCICIGGEVSRSIESIGRPARLLAGRLTGATPPHYLHNRVTLRIKTTSLPSKL